MKIKVCTMYILDWYVCWFTWRTLPPWSPLHPCFLLLCLYSIEVRVWLLNVPSGSLISPLYICIYIYIIHIYSYNIIFLIILYLYIYTRTISYVYAHNIYDIYTYSLYMYIYIYMNICIYNWLYFTWLIQSRDPLMHLCYYTVGQKRLLTVSPHLLATPTLK